MTAPGHRLRELLVGAHADTLPSALAGDAISDEQLADRLEDVRSHIVDIGSDVDPRSWHQARGSTADALNGMNDVIVQLIERIESARIDGFQRGLASQYRAVADLLATFYGFRTELPHWDEVQGIFTRGEKS